MKYNIGLIMGVLMFAFQLSAQPLKVDNFSVEQVEIGKAEMKAHHYAAAVDAFEIAAMRPAHTLRTTAIYLSGLASYYNQDWTNAIYRLQQILTQYPKSKYVADAKYHVALTFLQQPHGARMTDGLNYLYDLRSQATGFNSVISMEASHALKNFIFGSHVKVADIERYYPAVRPSFKLELMEAIVYQKAKQGQKDEAQQFYDAYRAAGGSYSAFVENILKNSPSASTSVTNPSSSREFVRIGVMLPLFGEENLQNDSTNDVLDKSIVALELLEGLREGLDEFSQVSRKKYFVQILDTQRDATVVENQLNDLNTARPDMIIGEVYNRQSRMISNWAERNQITQIVPLSPSKDLIEGKSYTFLMTASPQSHGAQMASFAANNLSAKNIVAWTDGKKVTEDLLTGFIGQMNALGGNVEVIRLDSVFDNALKQVQQYKGAMNNAQAIYIPILNEEILGYLLSVIDMNRLKAKVLTVPDIDNLEKVETDLKDRLQVFYTAQYFVDKTTEAYQNYQQLHFRYLNGPPSEYHIRGYDLAKYIMTVADDDAYSPHLAQRLRMYNRIDGLHAGIEFGANQDNQAVHILQMTPQGRKIWK